MQFLNFSLLFLASHFVRSEFLTQFECTEFDRAARNGFPLEKLSVKSALLSGVNWQRIKASTRIGSSSRQSFVAEQNF